MRNARALRYYLVNMYKNKKGDLKVSYKLRLCLTAWISILSNIAY